MTRNTELLSIEQVKELLEKTTPGQWEVRLKDEWARIWTSYGHYTLAERVQPRAAPMLAAGPDLARLCLSLAAQLQQEREARERLEGFIQGWQKCVSKLEGQLARSAEARKGDNQKARRLIREARAAKRRMEAALGEAIVDWEADAFLKESNDACVTVYQQEIQCLRYCASELRAALAQPAEVQP